MKTQEIIKALRTTDVYKRQQMRCLWQKGRHSRSGASRHGARTQEDAPPRAVG